MLLPRTDKPPFFFLPNSHDFVTSSHSLLSVTALSVCMLIHKQRLAGVRIRHDWSVLVSTHHPAWRKPGTRASMVHSSHLSEAVNSHPVSSSWDLDHSQLWARGFFPHLLPAFHLGDGSESSCSSGWCLAVMLH